MAKLTSFDVVLAAITTVMRKLLITMSLDVYLRNQLRMWESVVISYEFAVHGQLAVWVWLFKGITFELYHQLASFNSHDGNCSTFIHSSSILYRTQWARYVHDSMSAFWNSSIHKNALLIVIFISISNFNFFTIQFNSLESPDWNRAIWARSFIEIFSLIDSERCNAITKCNHTMQTLFHHVGYCLHEMRYHRMSFEWQSHLIDLKSISSLA